MSSATETNDNRALLKRALLKLDELQAELARLREPIAIIGLSCRFPAGANNPEAFWEILRDGTDAIREVPPDRWDVDAYYDATPGVAGKTYTRRGGFLDSVDGFDPHFFGIAPREAFKMDPQQRLLLEVVWEALERSGQAPSKVAGSRTAVFVGLSGTDYAQLQIASGSLKSLDTYFSAGAAHSIASGRISYLLGLQGPSISVDTACSSSLVAVHLACQSLRLGECDMALAGGVNLILSPNGTIAASQMRMLSTDSRCKTFDTDADGYVRAEGCAVVALKRLSKAKADGDNILAMIRGTAANQDGRSNGLTAPNGTAQEAVIREALAHSGVKPVEVSYVETHGTGTSLGDPIEVQALGAVLGQDRPHDTPVLIGAVKANIGHLEAAAGIAGLVKVILALQHKKLPPSLHVKKLNPHIAWEQLPVKVVTELAPWPAANGKRIAGVSSFGFSGTNVHVVVEEAPVPAIAPVEIDRPLHVLSLSAKSEAALRELADQFTRHLAAHPAEPLADVCFTANAGRSHFDQRLAAVAATPEEFSTKLRAFVAGENADGLRNGTAEATGLREIAFLFTGQGAQYVGMGRELYDTQPSFRRAIDNCDEILRGRLDRSLVSVLYPKPGEASPLDETAYTQPALFALEYVLAELWKSWGIVPSIVVGHSVGEYVAACVAGVMSLEDGLKLIAARGQMMQALPSGGEMAVMFGGEERVREALKGREDTVSIAAVNGPRNVVISGIGQAVGEVLEELKRQGIRSQKLVVSHAFHSPLMEPMLEEFAKVASEVTYQEARIGLVSNVTGEVVREVDAGYWVRHVREAVRFEASMKTLQEQGVNVYVEVGPSATLVGMGRQCLAEAESCWVPSLRQGRRDWQQMLESLAELYTHGVEVDWAGYDRPYPRRKVELPTYPFQRERYWIETKKIEKTERDGEQGASEIVRLLDQGNTEELIRKINSIEQFSESELQVLPKLLGTLVKQRREEINAAAVREWLYQVQWRERPKALNGAAGSAFDGGLWLVFADRGGIGSALARALEQQGARCVLVEAAESYACRSANRWQLNPVDRSHYSRLCEEVIGQGGTPLRGVVHLWGMDSTTVDAISAESLMVAQQMGYASVLSLVQSLIELSQAPRVWVVTRGAVQELNPAPNGAGQPNMTARSLGQAPLWGLGKVIALERPEIWGGIVDLDPESEGEAVEDLISELKEADGEDQVAWRSGRRYVPRLVRSKTQGNRRAAFDTNGSYLITGGLGGLGLQTAEWMAEHGARHLVLIGRSGAATADARQAVSGLESCGVKVWVAKADVTSLEDMSGVFADIQASMPPLRGIMHAAGVAAYQMLADLTVEDFEFILSPKVLGTWVLHQLTREMGLDFFVCFSSIASAWGSKGQGHYAAANQFLDAFAHYRHRLGLPAMSVNWGPWAGKGMLTEEFQTFIARLGVDAFPAQKGLTVLGDLLQSDLAQVIVADVDWRVFKAVYQARGHRPFLEEVGGPELSEDKQIEQPSGFLQQLKAAPESERQELLRAAIQAEVAQVLGFGPTQLPDAQQGFFDLGMDSLMAVDLRNRLERTLGCGLPSTLAFDHPTVDHLTNHLFTEVLKIDVSTELSFQKDDGVRAERVRGIKELSDEKLIALVNKEIVSLGGR